MASTGFLSLLMTILLLLGPGARNSAIRAIGASQAITEADKKKLRVRLKASKPETPGKSKSKGKRRRRKPKNAPKKSKKSKGRNKGSKSGKRVLVTIKRKNGKTVKFWARR